ncbi:hypothetical protein Tco_0323258 [Tanacetum coccineum]
MNLGVGGSRGSFDRRLGAGDWRRSVVGICNGFDVEIMMVVVVGDDRSKGKLAHLEQPLIPIPLPVAPQAVCDTYEVLYDAQNEVACLMLGSMSPDLQRALENYKAYDMIQELKTMFKEQAIQELFDTVKAFHACKQEDGQSVT